MDQIYLPYSPSNGVPQESKLATYMVNCILLNRNLLTLIKIFYIVQNRQNTSTPLCTNNLSQSFSKINIGSPISSKKQVTPQSPEFVPANRSATVSSTSASPNFFNSFPGLAGSNVVPGYNRSLVDSPHSGTASPRITPQPSPPPHALNNCSPTSFSSLEKPTVATTYQVKLQNSTTYLPCLYLHDN